MNATQNRQRLKRIALVIFAAYTALLLVNMPSVYYFNAQSPQPTDLWVLTVRLVWGMYLWALIAPFILWMGRLFRIAKPHLWRNIFIHLMISILTGLIRPGIYHLGLWAFGVGTFANAQSELFKTATYIQAVTGAIVTYPSIIAIQQAYLFFRESEERAFRLQQAELQMLKMQLHPHFFFNTLNAISALVYRSPKEADRMITQLGDLFRASLKKDRSQEISLREELEFLKSFLHIHQILMGKRLKIEWEIQPETLDALVPNLILQPLAENAIQHGIAPLEDGGQVVISAEKQNGNLLLQISDNGLGFNFKNDINHGIGLSNSRARLETLYKSAHRFSITESETGGISVEMKIPFRRQIEK